MPSRVERDSEPQPLERPPHFLKTTTCGQPQGVYGGGMLSFMMIRLGGFALLMAVLLSSCESTATAGKRAEWEARLGPVPTERTVTPTQMLNEIRLRQQFIPQGVHGRKTYRPMVPSFITIHSTQNFDAGADAGRHALGMRNGAFRAEKHPLGNRIGYLTWHFTVQDTGAVQTLPTGEQGEHADFDGPGNRFSIGIEMCEHPGNDRARTIDTCARLTAYLCYTRGIPVSRVVPHYHWPRRGLDPAHKDCPHFLLDGKRPGATWRWFQERVAAHLQRIQPGPAPQL
jgi:N-acetylmuramoyl-L-alanine amidase